MPRFILSLSLSPISSSSFLSLSISLSLSLPPLPSCSLPTTLPLPIFPILFFFLFSPSPSPPYISLVSLYFPVNFSVYYTKKKTALMYAAKLNSLAVVKSIVEYKPDVTLTDVVSEPQYNCSNFMKLTIL